MPYNISDAIEKFILDTIGDSSSVFISRNELAHYFSVAPSQINYVLSTRFTLDKGYDIESKRGGGGYITIKRLNEEGYLIDLVKNGVGEKIDFPKVCQILDRLTKDDIISLQECDRMKAVFSDKAMALPEKEIGDFLRANQLKSYLVCLMKQDE